MFAGLLKAVFGRPQPQADDRECGRRGEDAAAKHLKESGYRIVERNWRCPLGEIDLVAAKGGLTVVAEVKTSLRRGTIPPELRVNSRKRSKLRSLAAYYLKHRSPGGSIRFDVVAVWWDESGQLRVEHIENAF
ncbi:YraN family protein [candidate division KSB1 bacterium]|nr:YraN family protein [candidate division KSB1 bacterium]